MSIDSSKTVNALRDSAKTVQKAFTRLSTGKRINNASDDSAGLAIVSQLESSVKTSTQGARNAVDGISIASIADSALGTISDITSRQQELAAQSANGTLSDTQRQSLDSEYQQLEQEKGRILETTKFNDVNVFSGTTLQVGSDSSKNSQVTIPATDTSSITNSSLSIATASSAQSALDALNTQSQNIASQRGQIGAAASRVSVAEDRARADALESESAASRIRDADVAQEHADLTAGKIKQQIGVALAAQAGKLDGNSISRLLS